MDSALLRTVPFSETFIWDVKNYFRQVDTFNEKHPLVLFGDFLSKPNVEKTAIADSKEYKILGVRSYGKGAYINRTVKGDTLKMRTYQIAKKNHLFWCKVDTKNGAFGIIKDEHAQGVASSNMTFAKIDEQKANIDFVQLLFSSKKVNQYMDGYVTGTTNRKYIKPNQLLNEIKIPLPSLEEQNRIVDNYNVKIQLAEQQEAQAQELKEEVERYLFKKLDIEKFTKQRKKQGLNIINFERLEIWGADRLLRGGIKSVLESNKYPNQKIKNLVYVNPRTELSHLDFDDEMTFIPMKCVSDDYGEIITQLKGKKGNSKGYTKFQNGDLIWARITPCMQNGKSAIVSDLMNGAGYGSTEYHILRKKTTNFLIDFLYHLLRTKAVRQDAVNHFTGSAGQQRVPKTYLENLLVPLPPLNIQKNIVTHITELKDQIKILRTQAQANRESAIVEFEGEIFTTQ